MARGRRSARASALRSDAGHLRVDTESRRCKLRAIVMTKLCVRTFACAMLLALGGLTGCAGAKPWERETLAKPKMRFDDDPEAVLLEQHVYQYREGSSGGYGSGGGGCGCN